MGVFGILRSCVFRRIVFASLSSCFIVSCVLAVLGYWVGAIALLFY